MFFFVFLLIQSHGIHLSVAEACLNPIVSKRSTSFHLGVMACSAAGGQFPIIRNAAENADIYNLIRGGRTARGIWLALSDEASEGSWKWSDGSPLTYSRFDGEEDHVRENHAHMWATDLGEAGWNDNPAGDETIHILCCGGSGNELNETGFYMCDPCTCSYSLCAGAYIDKADKPSYECECHDEESWKMVLLMVTLIVSLCITAWSICVCYCCKCCCWRSKPVPTAHPVTNQAPPVVVGQAVDVANEKP